MASKLQIIYNPWSIAEWEATYKSRPTREELEEATTAWLAEWDAKQKEKKEEKSEEWNKPDEEGWVKVLGPGKFTNKDITVHAVSSAQANEEAAKWLDNKSRKMHKQDFYFFQTRESKRTSKYNTNRSRSLSI
jgi:hypothetical protein